jgi:thiamine biosynthesis protein ThiS
LRIIVNGQDREVADGAAVADLISLLDLKPERVAVELNRKILKRVEWAQADLSDGDTIEIVHFVGGGSSS